MERRAATRRAARYRDTHRADRAPPPGLGGRRRALRPGARGGAGARRRGGLRRAGGGARARRRALRRRRSTPSCSACTGTRASRWLAAVLAAADARRAADRAARRRCSPRSSRRPRRALPVTSWGTPRDLTTWSAPGGGRARLAPARRRAARGRRRRPACRTARCASCSRCSRPTGRSSPRTRRRATTRASAPTAHAAAFDAALAAPDEHAPALRNLAPHLGAARARRALSGVRGLTSVVAGTSSGTGRSIRPGEPYALPLAVANQPSPRRHGGGERGTQWEPEAPGRIAAMSAA